MALTRIPLGRSSRAKFMASCLRDDSTTVAPRSATARAIASPMPRLARR
jgi:hypothetical protein